jgi:RNA-directed DNA polymerase
MRETSRSIPEASQHRRPERREASKERNSMRGEQQKSQIEQAFEGGAKVKPEARHGEGTEPLAAGSRPESRVGSERMMEEVLERENLKEALKRVERNKGASGVDGMQVGKLRGYLKQHWPKLREDLVSGKYEPQPVRRVEIPKASGGVRKLGIPTVVDRFIQQAVQQVLQREWDRTFSDHSYGFRPNRTAHQAIDQAKEYINAGYGIVVDIDLEKFFDRVNHDVLMSRVARRVSDKRLLKLIRRYLNSGVMEEGLVSPTNEGTPQGGPLSPLLSNLMLDDLDRELERRGHRFVRYADDCNIYVRSERAGERVMAGVKEYLERRLRLKVNEQKSAVGKPSERKFLGYSFTNEVKARRRIAPESVKRFKERVREKTKRGRSLQRVVTELSQYLRGWGGYYGRSEWRSQLIELDQWIRRRLRRYVWQEWKRPRRRYRILRKHGTEPREAWRVIHFGPWRASRSKAVSRVLPNAYFRQIGLYSLERS